MHFLIFFPSTAPLFMLLPLPLCRWTWIIWINLLLYRFWTLFCRDSSLFVPVTFATSSLLNLLLNPSHGTADARYLPDSCRHSVKHLIPTHLKLQPEGLSDHMPGDRFLAELIHIVNGSIHFLSITFSSSTPLQLTNLLCLRNSASL